MLYPNSIADVVKDRGLFVPEVYEGCRHQRSSLLMYGLKLISYFHLTSKENSFAICEINACITENICLDDGPMCTNEGNVWLCM